MAQYPNVIKTFTTKVDQINVVYADDMNSAQGEITAIENALGTSPQMATNSLDASRHVDYGTVVNRLEAIQANLSAPAIALSSVAVKPSSGSFWTYTSWSVDQDDFGYASPSGFTTRDDAWWLINATGNWDPNSSGQRVLALMTNGSEEFRDSTPASVNIVSPLGQSLTYFQHIPGGTQVQLAFYQTSGKTLTCNFPTFTAIMMKRDKAYFTPTFPF